MKGVEKQHILKLYTVWYFNKFNNAPDLNKIYKLKALGYKRAKHGRIIAALYELIDERSDNKFTEYLNFIFDAWRDCKGAIESHFLGWLLSPKMMTRFKETKKKAKMVGDHKSNTYSDHSYAGESADSIVDFMSPDENLVAHDW